jgi:hypothetical protein
MTWTSDYFRWVIETREQLAQADGKRILQFFAIACLCFIMSVIAHKGFNDISLLAREHPDDFWIALGRYFLDNMAGKGR